LFQGALQRSGISLVGNANLLTKVYFPRLIIPFSRWRPGWSIFHLASGAGWADGLLPGAVHLEPAVAAAAGGCWR
jgi:hypothetical protein